MIVRTETQIARRRLVALLDKAGPVPVTLVTAPAGYGKSTLVTQWARATGRQTAWVALGPEANNPDRFRALLASAVDDAFPDCDAPIRADGSIDAIVEALDTRAHRGQPPILVFDDYHLIENRDVHDAMDGLVLRLPDGARVVLVSRTMPPLALGRLQLEGRLCHLTETDLRFTQEETAAIVAQQAPGRLTAAQVATLAARTEGWIAGIRLALLSLEQVDPAVVESLVDAWPVQRWLDDYIVAEVLGALPEDVGAFVLRTAILPALTPELCNAVLGIETSARLLDEVRSRLVFARPARTGPGVSYHPLFAESAARIADRTWPATDRMERHRRAARWYEAQGQLEAAVEQAVAAEDWEIAERCLRPVCGVLMDSGRPQSRLYWLGKLPEARVLADPQLARWYLSALQYTGQMREAQRVFAVVGPRWEASGDPIQLGYATSSRTVTAAMHGETDRALELACEALRLYPEDRAVDRLHAWTAVLQFEFHRGNDAAVEQAYREAARCREHLPAEQWWWTFQIELERANQLALRGDLRVARDLCHELLRRLPTVFRPYAGRMRQLLAAIALEEDDPDEAVNQAMQVEREVASAPMQLWHTDAWLVVARVYEALGDVDRAAATRRRLREMHDRHGGDRLRYRLEGLEALAWLRAGKIDLARVWVDHAAIVDQPWVRVFGDVDPRLVAARVELAAGEPGRAEARLRPLIAQARASKRWAELVPLGVWHAVACRELDDDTAALDSLRLALEHGGRGGLVRSSRTPGHDLHPLLDRLRDELLGDEAAYADRVLGVDGDRGTGDAPVGERVPAPSPVVSLALETPLSERELEVLGLLHAGCTNGEIADRLYITERTARKHVGNILRKLGVSNRTAAVTRALELDLL